MSKKVFAYVRKNIKSEDLDEQISEVKNYCKANEIDLDDRDLVIDNNLDNTLSRDGYKALSSYMMRENDILVITELDRLGRDISSIVEELTKLQEKNIELVITSNELLSTYNKTEEEKKVINSLVIQLLSYFSEKEKIRNKRKQAEGIQALKEKNAGKGIGRPKTKITKEFKEQYKLWKSNKQTAVETFKKLGLTKATFYRMVKEYEETEKKI